MNTQEIKNLFNNSINQTIKLSDLIMDAGTQMRAKADTNAINEYSEAMLRGETSQFPPIKVVALTEPLTLLDGSTLEAGALVLVDGFHRVDAAHKAKLTAFQGEVIEATLEEAKYYAMTTNATHGKQLAGKDYQNAIRELYNLNPTWREHGKQKEIAELFGCSTKTVERALKVVKSEIKAEAFQMFSEGSTDEEVAEFAVIHVKTTKEWREEWLKSCNEEAEGSEESGESEESKEPDNPMDLSFAQVLRLKNKELKAKLLKMLMDAVKEDTKEEKETENPKEPNEDLNEEGEEKISEGTSVIDLLIRKWTDRDCWYVLGKTKEDLDKLKNSKVGLQRAYNKQLTKCHPDRFGPNGAEELLKNAFAEAKKYFK